MLLTRAAFKGDTLKVELPDSKGDTMKVELPDSKGDTLKVELPDSIGEVIFGEKGRLVSFIAVAMSIYHLYANSWGFVTPMIHNSFHVLFALSLIFLTYPYKKSTGNERPTRSVFDYVFAVLAVVVNLYVILGYNGLIERSVEPNIYDKIFTVLLLLLVLEGGRRAAGIVLPLISVLALIYAYAGPYLPAMISHRGYNLERIVNIEFMTMEGIYGITTGASATMVFMFVFFGSCLMVSGGGKALSSVAFSVAGRLTGGPAKVSIVSSALFGTVSGSAVANVVVDGPFTIPLMKSVGFKPEFAGAVEAVASTGGMIMPPVMGAGAFIMAELIQVPYSTIIKAAIIPALLYYLGLFVAVHFEAKRLKLTGLPGDRLPPFGPTVLRSVHVLIPIIFLIVLISCYYPVMLSALYATFAVFVIGVFRKETRINLMGIFKVLENAALNILPIAAACACAGIVIGIISLTGIGLKFGSLVMQLSGGSTFIALFLTMIVLIILGMGLPATGAYIVGAAVAAPALIELGIPPLPANLFIFYFSIIGAVTPPVALAAYTAAGLAKSDPIKTGFTASYLALGGFIIPFVWIYNPALILNGTILEVIWAILTTSLGISALSIAIIGYLDLKMKLFERFLLALGGILLVHPSLSTDIVGLVLIIPIILSQYRRGFKERRGFIVRGV